MNNLYMNNSINYVVEPMCFDLYYNNNMVVYNDLFNDFKINYIPIIRKYLFNYLLIFMKLYSYQLYLMIFNTIFIINFIYIYKIKQKNNKLKIIIDTINDEKNYNINKCLKLKDKIAFLENELLNQPMKTRSQTVNNNFKRRKIH